MLDDRAVGHRIAERDADLDHPHAVVFERTDHLGGVLRIGIPGAKVDGEYIPPAGGE